MVLDSKSEQLFAPGIIEKEMGAAATAEVCVGKDERQKRHMLRLVHRGLSC